MRATSFLLGLSAAPLIVFASTGLSLQHTSRAVKGNTESSTLPLISGDGTNSDISSLDTALSQQGPEGRGRFDYVMKWVNRVSGPPALGYAIYGLVGDCKEYSENGEPADGKDCIPNAIWTVIAALACVHGYGQWSVELAQKLHTYAMATYGEIMGDMLQNTGGIDLGPYVRSGNEHHAEPVKRAIVLDAEAHLSGKFGREVHHVGDWDGSMPGQLARRNKGQNHPVFAFSREGQHFHVAFIDVNPKNAETRVKIGHGPGLATALNKRRLQNRDDDDIQYNAQYFDRGGFDGFGQHTGVEDGRLDLDPNNDLEWLHDEVVCSLNVEGPGSDFPGLWWGVLDHEFRTTYVTGGIAAFAPGVESIISHMTYEGHLEEVDQCMVNDDWFGNEKRRAGRGEH